MNRLHPQIEVIAEKSLGKNRYNRLRDGYWAINDGFLAIRAQRLPTKLFGPRFVRSRSRIEVFITYRCNLRCFNCNSSCRQAPSNELMTVEQIQMFIKESIAKDVNWERIRVLGGEPTLHPDLPEILSLLIEYKKCASADVRIQLVTNGFGSKVAGILSEVPTDIEIENSRKTGNKNIFTPFNKAPKDSILLKNSDFSNGCWVTKCGMGLTPHGYYYCSVAGSIDRVFGFDIGRKELPPASDAMVDQLRVFCELCGHFSNRRRTTTSELMSPTWKEAYKEYNKVKPSLSLIGH